MALHSEINSSVQVFNDAKSNKGFSETFRHNNNKKHTATEDLSLLCGCVDIAAISIGPFQRGCSQSLRSFHNEAAACRGLLLEPANLTPALCRGSEEQVHRSRREVLAKLPASVFFPHMTLPVLETTGERIKSS